LSVANQDVITAERDTQTETQTERNRYSFFITRKLIAILLLGNFILSAVIFSTILGFYWNRLSCNYSGHVAYRCWRIQLVQRIYPLQSWS